MSESRRVYVVTDHDGHGESYHMIAAFSTHEAAKQHVERLRGDRDRRRAALLSRYFGRYGAVVVQPIRRCFLRVESLPLDATP